MYTITEASVAGEVVVVETMSEVLEVVQGLCRAQITSPEWEGGYITTWAEGGATAMYFKGHDANGFGGKFPENAIRLMNRLNLMQD